MKYIYIYIYICMYVYLSIDDAFFNRNWAEACRGRWAEPELMLGWSAGSEGGTSLQKQERRGFGEGFARGRSDA